MFNLLQSASDDQTAIGACILTLAGAAVFVMDSFHLGPAGQKLKNRGQKNSNPMSHSELSQETPQSHERAA